MRRVLVAQSVGLWIRLNRHLSGLSAVELVETPTLESGRMLAQLERPAVVVVGREVGLEEAQALVETLLENERAETRVVFVSETASPSARPLRRENSGLVICADEELVSVVTELLAFQEEPEHSLDLLVHYRTESEAGGSEGFVVVLDLDGKSLLLQSDEMIEIGADLHLDFFVPGRSAGTHREKVSLSCRVDACRDERDLIYHANVSSIDGWAAEAVARMRRGGES